MEKLIDSLVLIFIFFVLKCKYHDYKEIKYIKNEKKEKYKNKTLIFNLNKNDLTEDGLFHRKKKYLSWLYFGITLFLWGFLKSIFL